jgi:hypothetical protein
VDLSGTRLEVLLTYNPDTGLFHWRGGHKRVLPGQIAGSPDKDGYILICVDQKMYKAHRLAWLWMTGEWPKNEIDHIDNVPANNRFVNLREATRQQNARNMPRHRDNKIGLKGVYKNKRGTRFIARATVNRKPVHLGCYSSKDDAHAAYVAFINKTYGEFGRSA